MKFYTGMRESVVIVSQVQQKMNHILLECPLYNTIITEEKSKWDLQKVFQTLKAKERRLEKNCKKGIKIISEVRIIRYVHL
jgi:hypothetical protein